MTGDARFADGAERPLRLIAQDAADVPVLSALVQDAVLTAGEMTWDRRRRRFAVLLGRFRWEDRAAAERAGRAYERVRCLLVVEDVLAVRSQGITRDNRDLVLSVLSVSWHPGAEGGGEVLLTLAGDGSIALGVEALEIRLEDVSRPYAAPSRKVPHHPGD
ncbi:MAG: DUF2948 family protein [Paracoccaceae bacterium]|nr:MAG: DUF2948 family protein [Paracoccaceae bacterium]